MITKRRSARRPLGLAFLYLMSAGMLALSGVLLAGHARTVLSVQQISLPLVASLPVMERRLSALTDQVEIAELQSSLRVGSQAERIRVFVLPAEPDFERLLAFFDIAGAVLTQQGVIVHLSEVDIGDPVVDDGNGVRKYPVSFDFSAHEDGIQSVLHLVRLAGFLTVGDALSDEQRSYLLRRSEEENPAGVVALEQFLSTDLLQYAQEPRPFEEHLLRSFASDAFASAFQSAVRDSFLHQARQLLGGPIGQELGARNLWPLPYLVLDDLELRKGNAQDWYSVSIVASLVTAVDPT